MDIESVVQLLQIMMLQETNLSSNDTSGTFQSMLEALTDNKSQGTSLEAGAPPENAGGSIDGAIEYCSKKYGVDDDLIKSVIKQESGFNANAVSSCGAEGLMQLMPSTAKSLGVDNPFNALENIDGGTRYLKQLINSFGGDTKLALAAYNGGIGRMKKLGINSEDGIKNMPSETQNYVSKVMKYYNQYKEKA